MTPAANRRPHAFSNLLEPDAKRRRQPCPVPGTGPRLRRPCPCGARGRDSALRTCKLTVTHDGLPAETETYRQIAGGMPYILSGLKTLLETGTPLAAAGAA